MAGAILAALIVVVGIWTVTESFPRNLAAGLALEGRQANLFGNLATLLAFVLCVAKALARRRESDAHKRLMLLASIAIVGQATQRIGFLIDFAPLGILSLVALPLVVFAYDLWSRKRVHWATVWGSAVLVACIVLTGVIANSPIGAAVMDRVYPGAGT